MDTNPSLPENLRNLQSLKLLGQIRPLFSHLHDQQCQRDKANNRTLHFDQLASLVMIALFNPISRSLRSLCQLSDIDHIRKRFDVTHASLGSLSEAARLFDPESLQGVITELTSQTKSVRDDPRLATLKNPLTAIDGTLLKALPLMVESAWSSTKDGRTRHAWRLHTHFDVDRSIPTRVELTASANSGDSDERTVLRKSLQSGRTYVMDRWFAQFTLFNAIVGAQSDYVCRVRENSRFTMVETRVVTAEASAVGVISDAVVQLGMSRPAEARPDHLTRLVVIRTTPHEKRGGSKGKTSGPSSQGELLLATNLIDVPAEIIGLIYQYRWTIEIFFRFFKQMLGCKHLLWEHPRGILLETYCAVIACLLINVSTGLKTTRRTYEMLCYFFLGLASLEEVTTHLAKRQASEAAKTKA